MKIYITMPSNAQSDSFLTPKARERLASLGQVEQNPYDRQLTVEEVIAAAKDADVLITSWGTCKYFKEHVEQMPNLKMIAHAGGAHRLWPHLKTHKMEAVLRIHMELGISRFKCATIAEAEMAAQAN